MSTYKILSIDGGGIRGIIPALILAKIEELTHQPISKMFDLIVGTSTGGILALGLNKPDEFKNPKYKANDLVKFYIEEGKRIFNSSFIHGLKSMNGLNRERYNAIGIENILKLYFGKTLLSESITEMLLTAYDIELRTPFFFRSKYAKNDDAYNYEMWEIARAISAAPTYFSPYNLDTKERGFTLIDGGVYINNPSLLAYVQAKESCITESEILMVSMGTGILSRKCIYNAEKWGALKWAQHIFDISSDSTSELSDYFFSKLLKDKFYRLQLRLDDINMTNMDDASEKNIDALVRITNVFMDDYFGMSRLEELCLELSK